MDSSVHVKLHNPTLIYTTPPPPPPPPIRAHTHRDTHAPPQASQPPHYSIIPGSLFIKMTPSCESGLSIATTFISKIHLFGSVLMFRMSFCPIANILWFHHWDDSLLRYLWIVSITCDLYLLIKVQYQRFYLFDERKQSSSGILIIECGRVYIYCAGQARIYRPTIPEFVYWRNWVKSFVQHSSNQQNLQSVPSTLLFLK